MTVNKPITITKVRVFSAATTTASRNARIWTSTSSAFSSGTLVATIDIPDTLVAGENVITLPTPYVVTAVPAYLTVSFTPSQDWWRLEFGFDVARTSADGAISTVPDAGRFVTTPGAFPTSPSTRAGTASTSATS